MFEETKLSPTDGGPIYFETDLENMIAEPWNTVTASLFIVMAAYWLIRLAGKRSPRYNFLRFAVVMLAVGGVGGTLYHALRSDFWLMMMDWLPILILVLSCSAYFLRRVFGAWTRSLAYISIAFLLIGLVFWLVPESHDALVTNLTYLMQSMIVLLPTILILRKTKFKYGFYVLASLVCFVLALFFRIVDPWGWIPMGTHFLWHLFGACSCQLMFLYVFRLEKSRRMLI